MSDIANSKQDMVMMYVVTKRGRSLSCLCEQSSQPKTQDEVYKLV